MPEQRHARVRIDALQSREKLVPVIRIGRRLVDVAYEVHQKGRLELVDGRQFSALAPERKTKRKSPWWKAFELRAVEQIPFWRNSVASSLLSGSTRGILLGYVRRGDETEAYSLE